MSSELRSWVNLFKTHTHSLGYVCVVELLLFCPKYQLFSAGMSNARVQKGKRRLKSAKALSAIEKSTPDEI